MIPVMTPKNGRISNEKEVKKKNGLHRSWRKEGLLGLQGPVSQSLRRTPLKQ